jgi:hypothetical protein
MSLISRSGSNANIHNLEESNPQSFSGYATSNNDRTQWGFFAPKQLTKKAEMTLVFSTDGYPGCLAKWMNSEGMICFNDPTCESGVSLVFPKQHQTIGSVDTVCYLHEPLEIFPVPEGVTLSPGHTRYYRPSVIVAAYDVDILREGPFPPMEPSPDWVYQKKNAEGGDTAGVEARSDGRSMQTQTRAGDSSSLILWSNAI